MAMIGILILRTAIMTHMAMTAAMTKKYPPQSQHGNPYYRSLFKGHSCLQDDVSGASELA